MNEEKRDPGRLVRAYRYHSLLPIEAQNRLIESVGLREGETAVQRNLRISRTIDRVKSQYPEFSELVLTRPPFFYPMHQYVSECPAQRRSTAIRI